MRYEKEGQSMKYVIRWRGGYMEFNSQKEMTDWMKIQKCDFPNICIEVK